MTAKLKNEISRGMWKSSKNKRRMTYGSTSKSGFGNSFKIKSEKDSNVNATFMIPENLFLEKNESSQDFDKSTITKKSVSPTKITVDLDDMISEGDSMSLSLVSDYCISKKVKPSYRKFGAIQTEK